MFGIFAISLGVIPADAQSDHPNLTVSSPVIYEDHFSVIEIIIDDPDISDTSIIQTEPDVTLNTILKIRMAQATDGKWYGYFANADVNYYNAIAADSTVTTHGTGFDFGEFCDFESLFGINNNGAGVAVSRHYSGTVSSSNGDEIIEAISSTVKYANGAIESTEKVTPISQKKS